MAVRVIHEIQVFPYPSLPSQPPQLQTFLDSLWLHLSPVERLFFYDFPHPISHFIDHHLPSLTKSLSLTLHAFYPLAGNVRRSGTSEDQNEISYQDGDSVTITLAEFTGDDFPNISGYQPHDFRKLRLLVPQPPKSSGGQYPPLSVQVTLFPNQGLCIAFAVNHAVCDGSGSMQFIRSWAATCRSLKDSFEVSAPLLDRSIIADTRGLRRKLFELTRAHVEKFPDYLEKQGTEQSSSLNLVAATFFIGKDKILRLKERVKARAAEKGMPSFHCSAFVVTTAYVWRCLIEARGYDDDHEQMFAFGVDWRSRMKPAIPSNYFGNCLGGCMTFLKAGEVVAEDGVEVATTAIGKSIDELQGMDVADSIEALIDRSAELASKKPLTVAGSPKLRVYETDFGWGRPVKVEMTSIKETGAISLAESRDDEGGMEIGMVLSKDEMDEFRSIFANGLLDL